MHQYFSDFQNAVAKTMLSDQRKNMLLRDEVTTLVQVFREAKQRGSKLFFIGNGGSAAIAQHMTVDYLKNGGMVTYGLHNAANLTCLGNDFGYEAIFSKQLALAANEGDLLAAISSSGKSANILNGVQAAKEKGCKVVTLSGFQAGNPLSREGDLNIYVPSNAYGIVESVHNMVLQMVVDLIMETDGVGIQ